MRCETRSIIDFLKAHIRKTASVCYGRQYVILTFSAFSEYVFTYFNKILLCWLTRLSKLLNTKNTIYIRIIHFNKRFENFNLFLSTIA